MVTYITTQEKIRKNQAKWMADNGTLIGDRDFANNTTTNVYTVPANKVLYVTQCFLSWHTDGAGDDADSYLRLHTFTALWNSGMDGAWADHQAVSFPIPVKLTAGQIIGITSGTDGQHIIGGFIGYLFDA